MEFLNKLLIRTDITSPELEELAPKVSEFAWQIAGIVISIVAGLAGIFMIIKMISLGIKLSQVSEEPEERSRIIKGMIWWGIGFVVCLIAATVAPSVIFSIFGNIKTEIGTGGGEATFFIK